MRQNLKTAREKINGTGATQKEIATAIGISEIYYRNIENGNREGKGRIWDALEALFGIPQRQLREDNTQEDFNTKQDGIAEAQELESAQRGFDLDVGAVADLIDNGRFDHPENRAKAERLHAALGAALV